MVQLIKLNNSPKYYLWKEAILSYLHTVTDESSFDRNAVIDLVNREEDDISLLTKVSALLEVNENLQTSIQSLKPVTIALNNPEYNDSQLYVPRSQRKEWIPVGLMGKIVVRDDGTLIPGRKCTCTTGGIATFKSNGKWTVLRRISRDTCLILFR